MVPAQEHPDLDHRIRQRGTRAVQDAQSATTLAIDCTITVRLTGLLVAKGQTYSAEIDAYTAATAPKRRTLAMVGA